VSLALAIPAFPEPSDEWTLRMKDLCELTGLPRQAVHFYIQQGLVPPGRKTGRNTALYGQAHVERIQLVRKLQNERFLPLKAIRAMLDRREEGFSPEQRQLLADVRARLRPLLGGGAPDEPEPALPALPLLHRLGLERQDLDDLCEANLLAVREDEPGHPFIAESDAWILEIFAELRAAGFSRALGFTGKDFATLQQVVSTLVSSEERMLTERISHLPPDEVAGMLGRALPLMNTMLARYHLTLAKNFLGALGAEKDKE
jgi:DNA-binding transcriptional MerR regulator